MASNLLGKMPTSMNLHQSHIKNIREAMLIVLYLYEMTS